MDKLIDKTKSYTLVTGATGGLGRAFVKELAKNGTNLILVATKEDRLEVYKKELLDEFDIKIMTFKCDFSIKEDLEKLTQYIQDGGFTISTLVNNAGFICEGSNKAMSIENLQKCIMVNNIGTTTLTKAFLDKHDKASHLDIVTISSLGANYPMPFMAVYSATKSYLKNYMLALRQEYKWDNVNISTILPGAIATSDDMKKAVEAQGLKGKLSLVAPEKIARMSLNAVKKNKAIVIPGWFNKLTNLASKITPQSLQIKVAGKMWKKSQEKRGIK